MSTMTVLKSRFDDAKMAINSRYQIHIFLDSKGIHTESNKQICCPFHDDSTPSFSVNFETNAWKCFGCQNGGRFIDLWKTYQNKYENCHYSIYSAVETILEADSELQAALGFKSIYKTEEDEFNLFKQENEKFKFEELLTGGIELKQVNTDSMKHVLRLLEKETPDTLVQFVLDCQNGMNESQLINKYYKKQFDVEEFISAINITDDSDALTSAFLEALE